MKENLYLNESRSWEIVIKKSEEMRNMYSKGALGKYLEQAAAIAKNKGLNFERTITLSNLLACKATVTQETLDDVAEEICLLPGGDELIQ